METRDLETAQHEAAHVVVGVALGLRLRRAAVGPLAGDPRVLGYAWFSGGGRGQREAWALMYAAGMAWDQALGFDPVHTEYDRLYCREHASGARGVAACVRAASAMLAGLAPVHARVTRALLERDITGADVAAMCRGEAIE